MTIDEKADYILKTEPNFHDVKPTLNVKVCNKINKRRIKKSLKREEKKNG